MDMSVWYLLGAVLVFFMQCGFAMVETGFTRAKNAGNIIMKNLMDFCIGTVVFFVLGYGIMNSENYFFGLIGRPEYQMFTDFANFDWSNFFFQLVFCATAATIVSGAMAERTKFSTYCIYSAVISAIVYPIEAGWVWNSAGWLAKLGYVDFAGSSVIHMVGGIASVIGAAMLGPRIGKYTKGKDGKTVVNAFPGHSLTLGALGCFILWFAPTASTFAHPAVIPTRPAKEAFRHMETSGAPFLIHVNIIQTKVATAGAIVVVPRICANCVGSDAAAPLNPYHANHKIKHPISSSS